MHTLQTLDVLQNDYTCRCTPYIHKTFYKTTTRVDVHATDTRRSTKTTTRADVHATYTRRSIKTTTRVDAYATYTRRSTKRLHVQMHTLQTLDVLSKRLHL